MRRTFVLTALAFLAFVTIPSTPASAMVDARIEDLEALRENACTIAMCRTELTEAIESLRRSNIALAKAHREKDLVEVGKLIVSSRELFARMRNKYASPGVAFHHKYRV